MTQREQIREALTTAANYIRDLPEGVPYYVNITESATAQDPGQLEIAPRTHLEYYAVAHQFNRKPTDPIEIIRHFGCLEIAILPPPKGDNEDHS